MSVGAGHWQRLLACLLGILIGRTILTRLRGHRPSRPPAPAARPMRCAMRLSPDELIFWQHGVLKLNATIVFTWGLMLLSWRSARSWSRADCPGT